MRVGVLSDSHGNIGGLIDALDYLKSQGAERIFFLGHDVRDLEKVLDLKKALKKAESGISEDTDFLMTVGEFLDQKEGITPKLSKKKITDEVSWFKQNLLKVPGEGEPEYLLKTLPDREFEIVGGRILLFVHNPKVLSKEDLASASLILYGFTHLYQVNEVGGRYFINPGHLMNQEDQGRPPTFAIVELEGRGEVTILDLRFRTLLSQPLDLEKKRKLTVQ
jgi:predicted phosphodiesterase